MHAITANHQRLRLGRFGVWAPLLLAIALLFAFTWSLRTDSSGSQMLQGLPKHVTIQQRTFSSYQEKLENERMGLGTKQQRLSFLQDGSIVHQGNRHYLGAITRIDSSGDAMLLSTGTTHLPNGKSGGRFISVRTPLPRDYLHPTGLWAFSNIKNDKSSALGLWAYLNDDGTGLCDWGKRDATDASQAYIQKRGNACTWHAMQRDGGYLVVLDYEGGQALIAITM